MYRVLTDADILGDELDCSVPYVIVDQSDSFATIQRADGAWFANEFEWCVRLDEITPWKFARAEVLV